MNDRRWPGLRVRSAAPLLAAAVLACTEDSTATPVAGDTGAPDVAADVVSPADSADTAVDDTAGPPPIVPVDPSGGTLLVDGAPTGPLLSLWSDRSGTADAPESVWMVGGLRGQPLVLEAKGGAFVAHDPGVARRAWWVTGLPSGALWVVGEGGVASRYRDGAWTPFETGAPGTTLYGVWGAADDDVWAVGGPDAAPGEGVTAEGNVVLHFDGTAWSREDVPPLEGLPPSAGKYLFKVWGADPDHVFVVGSGGRALHREGGVWRLEPTGDTQGPLFTVSGRAADDVYAIGGLNQTRVVHWDGAAWSPIAVGEFAPTVAQGLFVAPGVGLVVSGISGYVAALTPDGSWVEPDPETAAGFHAVWVDGAGSVWAVGGDIMSGDPASTALYTTREGLTPPAL